VSHPFLQASPTNLAGPDGEPCRLRRRRGRYAAVRAQDDDPDRSGSACQDYPCARTGAKRAPQRPV